MRVLALLTALCVLAGAAVWLRHREPVDVREEVPARLYGEWVAADGPHAGSRLVLGRERVEISSAEEALDSGPLLAIHRVEGDGAYPTFRIVYGYEEEPGALLVTLDAEGRLRLANHPASVWEVEAAR